MTVCVVQLARFIIWTILAVALTLPCLNSGIAQAQELLTPNEAGRGFEKRYFEALQRDPDVVLAHGKTRKLVESLG